MSNFRLLRRGSPFPLYSGNDAYLARRSPVECETYELQTEAINRALLLPSFRVHRADVDQAAVPSGVVTLLQFNSIAAGLSWEGFDDFGYFDPATYRYQPKIAGVYQFGVALRFNEVTAATSVIARIHRTGPAGANFVVANVRSIAHDTISPAVSTAGICRMNGESDYIEFHVFQDSGSPQDVNGAGSITFAYGCKLADY